VADCVLQKRENNRLCKDAAHVNVEIGLLLPELRINQKQADIQTDSPYFSPFKGTWH